MNKNKFDYLRSQILKENSLFQLQKTKEIELKEEIIEEREVLWKILKDQNIRFREAYKLKKQLNIF